MFPLAVLVFMLFNGFTPMFAGICRPRPHGGADPGRRALAAGFGSMAFRIVFWIAPGSTRAAFFQYGIWPGLVAMITALVAGRSGHQGRPRDAEVSCAGASPTAPSRRSPSASPARIVGVIIGVLTLTGAASNFAGFVLEIGEKSLFASLVLTMAVCLVLGMGIPTIPNYIITSAIAAPALMKLGVPLIVSHMFVFYFGIMADLTPPVALAAFAAASISKASPIAAPAGRRRISRSPGS